MWIQKKITLASKPRGFHLVTQEIFDQLPEIGQLNVGFVHLLLLHTSASLTLNENADPDVRLDMERFVNQCVPEQGMGFVHTLEGADDMPAHIKSSLFGVSLQIPIADHRVQLGTWQGIYLGEHRDYGGARSIHVTMMGEVDR